MCIYYLHLSFKEEFILQNRPQNREVSVQISVKLQWIPQQAVAY